MLLFGLLNSFHFIVCVAAASSSIKIANRDGERGHPCLVPSSSVKCGEVTPFLITVAPGVKVA